MRAVRSHFPVPVSWFVGGRCDGAVARSSTRRVGARASVPSNRASTRVRTVRSWSRSSPAAEKALPRRGCEPRRARLNATSTARKASPTRRNGSHATPARLPVMPRAARHDETPRAVSRHPRRRRVGRAVARASRRDRPHRSRSPGFRSRPPAAQPSESGLSKVRDEARKKRAKAIPAEELHDRQRAVRSVRHWRDDLGMIAGTFRLTPDVGVPFVNRLERQAQRLRRAASSAATPPSSSRPTPPTRSPR